MTLLYTSRLYLEPLKAGHADILVESLQHPDIYRFIPTSPLAIEALRKRYAFLEGRQSPDGKERWLNWVLFQKAGEGAVGTFEATVRENGEADIAYVIFPSYWKQGFAREAGAAVIEHLRLQYGVPCIGADIDSRNASSIALVEWLGLKRVKFTPNADFFRGESSDEFRYELRG
ncbi:MAG: GNAT family N-acetyltransferase [Deltaproteobacteria bacterium]